MKIITDLTDGSEIQVRGILGKITVQTLAATAAKYGETLAYHQALDKKFNRATQFAWTMQHASVLTADYPGKAEAHAAARAATEAAPVVDTDDILVVDGVPYTARVMGNYSDPVKLLRDVYQEGYKAFTQRKGTLDNPFEAGTPEHEKWYDGWCKADHDDSN